jgi:hypothetical protein
MSLADLIAAKKANLSLSKIESLSLPEGEIAPIFLAQQSYPIPNFDLFVAAWTPALKFPHTIDTMVRREYIHWLLSPSLYVLNTFIHCDSDIFFSTFMKEHPPTKRDHLYNFNILLADIDLFVPKQYQETFLRIIKGEIEASEIPT